MRAVVVREFGGIENAALGDMPKPEPKAGEVLLEVRAVAVNFVDLVMMSGNYQFKPPLPFIPGKLPVGVVAAVGAGVTQVQARRPRAADGGAGGLCRIRGDAGEPVHQAAAVAAVRRSRLDGAGLRHRLFRAEGSRPDRAGRDRAGARRDRRRRPRRDPARQGVRRQGAGRRRQQGQGGHRARGRRRRDRRPVRAGPAREPARSRCSR